MSDSPQPKVVSTPLSTFWIAAERLAFASGITAYAPYRMPCHDQSGDHMIVGAMTN